MASLIPPRLNTAPKPDFFFLWLYGVLSLMPGLYGNSRNADCSFVVIAILFAVPFISNTGEKSPRRRPVAVLSVLLILIVLGAFNYLGTYAPWSPRWKRGPARRRPRIIWKDVRHSKRQGALVFHNKQCINCHSVGGEGGLARTGAR